MRASDELQARLNRIYASDAFQLRRFGPARWIRGGTAFTTVEPSPSVEGADDLVEHDTKTGSRSVILSASQLKPNKDDKPLRIEDYSWDPEAKRLLLFTNTQKVWRSNSRGDYFLFERASGKLKKLGGDKPAKSLMFAKFSPDGSRVAWVSGNNLYVEELETGNIRALTNDGSDTLVNGTSDWVYEEELNVRDGFRWSPDGRNLAFLQFDSSGVQQFSLINNTDSLYPKITNIPYPKAGTKNSAVRVGVVSVDGKAAGPRWLALPGDARENYVFRTEWLDENRVAVAQLNRKQNKAVVYLGDAASGAVTPIFSDTDDAWVDVPENGVGLFEPRGFDWLNGRKSFVWLSERDGWRHAYSVPVSGKQPALLTPGDWDAEGVLAADPESRFLYFIASPGNATERYLYRVALDGASAPVRVTPEARPGVHTYRVSPDCRWAFHTWSQFDRPPVTELISLPDHKTVRVLEENLKLRANAVSVTEPAVEFLQVRVSDGLTLDGWLLKPRNFDPAKKYPLIVHVYGEPAGTTVVNAWGGDGALFHRALAEDGYLIASFDNRGTPAPKGRAWRKAVYGAVGVLSAKEQTEAVYALARQRAYIDLNRVGVWGWSGGGSNTLNLMFRSPELFRVGVSVAPVPDQKLYDTIYQERYMGLPEENAEGYRMGSPINFAEGLRGKLLVVHGTGDDNVHQQGTEKLVNRLIELGKRFDYMAYPNRTHAISEGPGTTLHVRRLIADYFERYLPAGPQ
jgi:dipeptidyl-peptidase-4